MLQDGYKSHQKTEHDHSENHRVEVDLPKHLNYISNSVKKSTDVEVNVSLNFTIIKLGEPIFSLESVQDQVQNSSSRVAPQGLGGKYRLFCTLGSGRSWFAPGSGPARHSGNAMI